MKKNICNEVAVSSDWVYQSWIFSTSQREVSIYGERLLVEILLFAQEYIIDKALGLNSKDFSNFYSDFAELEIPVEKILYLDDKSNYSAAKKACEELMRVFHTIEKPKELDNGEILLFSDGTPQYYWSATHLIQEVDVNKKSGMITVKITSNMWDRILDMTKGYSRYSLGQIKLCKIPVAMRLSQIMYNQGDRPLFFSFDMLKSMFRPEKKYDQPSGFIKRVIKPAEDEINKLMPFSVTHEEVYDDKLSGGRKAIVGLNFIKTPKSRGKINIVYNDGEIARLEGLYGFDYSDLNSQYLLFLKAKELGIDVFDFFSGIKQAERAFDKPAYLIGCLKNKVKELDGSSQSEIIKSGFKMIEEKPQRMRRRPDAQIVYNSAELPEGNFKTAVQAPADPTIVSESKPDARKASQAAAYTARKADRRRVADASESGRSLLAENEL